MRVGHDDDGNRMEIEDESPEELTDQLAKTESAAGTDGKIRLSVDGHPLTIDPVAVQDAGWSISDLVYWSDWLGRARYDLTMVEAAYRAHRGRGYESMLQANSKAAEWKIKATLEAGPKYLALKESIGQCERNLIVLQGIVAAIKLAAPCESLEAPL